MRTDLEGIKEWGNKYPIICTVYICGSRARGDFKEGSDLDIAIDIDMEEGDENKSATWIYESENNEWEKELNCLTPHKVHLHLYDENETIKADVDEDGIVVYSRDEDTSNN